MGYEGRYRSTHHASVRTLADNWIAGETIVVNVAYIDGNDTITEAREIVVNEVAEGSFSGFGNVDMWEFTPTAGQTLGFDVDRMDVDQPATIKLDATLGKVGIPIMGYNFSIAGVWGHVVGPWARGGAESVALRGAADRPQPPIPHGQVWNMIYDPNAPPGTIARITSQQLWDRAERLLEELVPVAAEAGVRLAAHPDDPPLPTLRGTPRLVYQPDRYQRLLDLVPSPANALEFCVGTIAEMTAGDVYTATETYSRQGAIAYVHLRNVRGKVPDYEEVFIDEGDVDIVRILRILHQNGFQGVVIPDHTPSLQCAAPWHAGMAYAIATIRAALKTIESD